MGHVSSTEMEFCKLIEPQQFARVDIQYTPSNGLSDLRRSRDIDFLSASGEGEKLTTILGQYQLTPRDKIILGYTIAKAYHQFYDSELLRSRWTSDNIWLMPLVNKRDGLPLRPYLAFPFGTTSYPNEDFIQDERSLHRHPRILAIGILLLEIGLAKPLPQNPSPVRTSQINWSYQIAKMHLKELKDMPWDNFQHKSFYENVIEYCIQEVRRGENSSGSIQNGGAREQSSIRPDTIGKQGRKNAFYDKVVVPLQWLAERGFGHHEGNTIYLHKARTRLSNDNFTDTFTRFMASFYDERNISSSMWLRDMEIIGQMVELQRRNFKVSRRIRVAILDTGFDNEDDNYDEYEERIKETRDFTKFGVQSKVEDIFGHGTLMAKLIMDCAPSADIIIARVAKSTADLEIGKKNICQAIEWAGIDCKADIITMAFGFPRDDQDISKAIEKVHSKQDGNIIFMASAGNSPNEDENFPARHRLVIPIYATNRYGTFLETNPSLRDDSPTVLGMYGADLPDNLYTGLNKKFSKVCQPGSSVATAIGTSVGAIILAYATVLPHLANKDLLDESASSILELLWTGEGMRAMFKEMVRNKQGRQWFVDLIAFWRDTKSTNAAENYTASDINRFHRIQGSLQLVQRASGRK
ncbi:Peptidase_S8 domain-containing protein [Trichoderma simmonsii]|nr:Peptidase_S8 domain-containing protein [Trichoderma simmonsii]